MGTDAWVTLQERVSELEAQLTSLIELVTQLSIQLSILEATLSE